MCDPLALIVLCIKSTILKLSEPNKEQNGEIWNYYSVSPLYSSDSSFEDLSIPKYIFIIKFEQKLNWTKPSRMSFLRSECSLIVSIRLLNTPMGSGGLFYPPALAPVWLMGIENTKYTNKKVTVDRKKNNFYSLAHTSSPDVSFQFELKKVIIGCSGLWKCIRDNQTNI